MNQQIQHVVSLTAHLQTRLNPIECCRLEKFRRFERPEQIAFLLRLRSAMLQRIQHVIFQQFLVADAYLHRMTGWTMLLVPTFDEWHIESTTCTSRAHIEWPWCPQQRNAIGCVVCVERSVLQKCLNFFVKCEFFIFVEATHFSHLENASISAFSSRRMIASTYFDRMTM